MSGFRRLARFIDELGRLLPPKTIAIGAIVASIATGAFLALRHATLGGPGDELRYYDQAADLFPFRDHYYGPLYFFALRFVHMVGLDWYEAGKLIGFLSACVFIWLSHLLFRRVLAEPLSWYATAIVAVNSQVIAESYSTLTILFGSVWVLAAIVVIAGLPAEKARGWFIGGLLLGVASLSRTQSFGFLLGAIACTVFLPGVWRLRLRAAALLVVGAAIPMMSWKVLLLATQGSVPQSWNFVHLTYPLGEFTSFQIEDNLIAKYGSTWGVFSADPMNLPRILIYGVKQILRLPVGEGLEVLGPPGFFLVPGILVAISRRDSYAPWVGAFVAGLFLTGLASRGWLMYYIPLVPLFAYLIVLAADSLVRDRGVVLSRLTWATILGGAFAWAAVETVVWFRVNNWPEWATVREYINRNTDSTSLVSSTAGSLRYNAKFKFIDYDEIMEGHDTTEVVDVLRANGVTHLVVEARHMVPEYPNMEHLLDDTPVIPPGLIRDTLIVSPSRVAVYRVVR